MSIQETIASDVKTVMNARFSEAFGNVKLTIEGENLPKSKQEAVCRTKWTHPTSIIRIP